MNCIIIDDEMLCIKSLNNLLDIHFPQVKILATCNDSTKAMGLILHHKPDFIFLDYNNTSKNTQEITATIQNFNNTDEINIVLYTDEVEDPGLLSIIDQSHHIKTIIKTPDLKNNLSKLINEFSSIKTPA